MSKPISAHLEGFFVGVDRTGKAKRKKPSVVSQQQKKVAQFQITCTFESTEE